MDVDTTTAGDAQPSSTPTPWINLGALPSDLSEAAERGRVLGAVLAGLPGAVEIVTSHGGTCKFNYRRPEGDDFLPVQFQLEEAMHGRTGHVVDVGWDEAFWRFEVDDFYDVFHIIGAAERPERLTSSTRLVEGRASLEDMAPLADLMRRAGIKMNEVLWTVGDGWLLDATAVAKLCAIAPDQERAAGLLEFVRTLKVPASAG